MIKNKEDCWMSFSDALVQFLKDKKDMESACNRQAYILAEESLKEAADHMDVLTDSMHLRGS